MKHVIAAGILVAIAGLMVGRATAQDNAPRIDDIVWQYIDSYCTFTRADHVFDYNDPESWRWVLFSNYPGEDGTDPLNSPFMRIDGQLVQLMQTGVEQVDGGVIRTYQSHDAEPYIVAVKMHEGAESYESAAYSGTIVVSRKGASNEIPFKGDCGV